MSPVNVSRHVLRISSKFRNLRSISDGQDLNICENIFNFLPHGVSRNCTKKQVWIIRYHFLWDSFNQNLSILFGIFVDNNLKTSNKKYNYKTRSFFFISLYIIIHDRKKIFWFVWRFMGVLWDTSFKISFSVGDVSEFWKYFEIFCKGKFWMSETSE